MTAFASASALAGAMRRASVAHGEHEKRIGAADPDWPDWYAKYMVAEQPGTDLPVTRVTGSVDRELNVKGRLEMPWFPDFITAMELARIQTRADGLADPVAQYVRALNDGASRVLEDTWPGRVVIYDPRAGEVRGHRELRSFISRNNSWLAEHGLRVETVASIRVRGRAVVELLAHLSSDGPDVAWPVAVVAESIEDLSVVFRTYCSQQPVDGRRHVRAPILQPGADRPGDVIGRYQAALNDGDVDAIVGTFTADGYYREPIGADIVHRGADQLRSFFTGCFSRGGGIGVTPCAVTDDGVHCAVEYNCVRWGSHDLKPQAGIGIYERGPDGLLAAVRVYDDVEAPIEAAV